MNNVNGKVSNLTVNNYLGCTFQGRKGRCQYSFHSTLPDRDKRTYSERFLKDLQLRSGVYNFGGNSLNSNTEEQDKVKSALLGSILSKRKAGTDYCLFATELSKRWEEVLKGFNFYTFLPESSEGRTDCGVVLSQCVVDKIEGGITKKRWLRRSGHVTGAALAFTTGGVKVMLLCVHVSLNAGKGSPDWDFPIPDLVADVDRAVREGYKVVIGGDMNGKEKYLRKELQKRDLVLSLPPHLCGILNAGLDKIGLVQRKKGTGKDHGGGCNTEQEIGAWVLPPRKEHWDGRTEKEDKGPKEEDKGPKEEGSQKKVFRLRVVNFGKETPKEEDKGPKEEGSQKEVFHIRIVNSPPGKETLNGPRGQEGAAVGGKGGLQRQEVRIKLRIA